MARGRDAAVERNGNLHGDEWKRCGDEFGESVVEPARLLLENSELHLHPRRTKLSHALTVNHWVGVGGCDHHTCDPRGYQCVRTWPGSSLVAAGFQGHIRSRPPGHGACLVEGNNLRVIATVILVKALTHQGVVPDQHAADRRVGRGETDGLLGLAQRFLHPLLVDLLGGLGHRG